MLYLIAGLIDMAFICETNNVPIPAVVEWTEMGHNRRGRRSLPMRALGLLLCYIIAIGLLFRASTETIVLMVIGGLVFAGYVWSQMPEKKD